MSRKPAMAPRATRVPATINAVRSPSAAVTLTSTITPMTVGARGPARVVTALLTPRAAPLWSTGAISAITTGPRTRITLPSRECGERARDGGGRGDRLRQKNGEKPRREGACRCDPAACMPACGAASPQAFGKGAHGGQDQDLGQGDQSHDPTRLDPRVTERRRQEGWQPNDCKGHEPVGGEADDENAEDRPAAEQPPIGRPRRRGDGRSVPLYECAFTGNRKPCNAPSEPDCTEKPKRRSPGPCRDHKDEHRRDDSVAG